MPGIEAFDRYAEPFEFCQTLGCRVIGTGTVEPAEKGYGKGLFAVIKASK
jgi:hypothetical protein